MEEPPFTASMFSRRPHNSRVEAELRHWLLTQTAEARMDFVKEIFKKNYPFALILTQAMRLSSSEIESLLRNWLRASNHNAAGELIRRMEPMLGSKKFWRVAREEQMTEAMRDFMNYQSHGRLDSEPDSLKPDQGASR